MIEILEPGLEDGAKLARFPNDLCPGFVDLVFEPGLDLLPGNDLLFFNADGGALEVVDFLADLAREGGEFFPAIGVFARDFLLGGDGLSGDGVSWCPISIWGTSSEVGSKKSIKEAVKS